MYLDCPPPKSKSQIINSTKYYYFLTYYWDSTKKYGTNKRQYIGKEGPNNSFIPNNFYITNYLNKNLTGDNDNSIIDILNKSRHLYFGATYLLDQISCITGIMDDLKISFPKNYKQILSLAYYLVIQKHSPYYCFDRFNIDHYHPFGKNITSQESSNLLLNITDDAKNTFFKLQAERRLENEYLAYDTTSISSMSKQIKLNKWGRNKDKEHLSQVNLALLFGEKSFLPVYYRLLPGNISDVSLIVNLIKEIKFLNIKNFKLVLDRGFYSAENINLLYSSGIDFIISAKRNLTFIKENLEKYKEDLLKNDNYDFDANIHALTIPLDWNYIKKTKSGQIEFEQKRQLYLHMYFNAARAADEKISLVDNINNLIKILKENNKLIEKSSSYFLKFINIHKDNNGNITSISHNKEAITKHMDECGFFMLLTNYNKSSSETLKIYKNRDTIEKSFDNIKDILELDRTQVHSDIALQGRLFIAFISLILISWLQKMLKINNIYKNHTLNSFINSLDIIELYIYKDKVSHLGEITEKQKKMYLDLGIDFPVVKNISWPPSDNLTGA
jgi:transposase